MAVIDRKQFPFLELHYFDNATFTLVPKIVNEEVKHVSETHSGSPRQATHRIGLRGIEKLNQVRRSYAKFFQVKSSQVIFMPDTSDAFYSIAFGLKSESNKILVSEMLDHTALLPWYQAKQINNLEFSLLVHDEFGFVNLDDFRELLSQSYSTVVIPYVVPGLGTRNPIREIIDIAHSYGVQVVLDGRLISGHQKIDLSFLDCDAYICDSNIGLMGPPGFSVLIGKEEYLSKLHPFRVGAGSIKSVNRENFNPLPPPEGFEPGVGNISALAGGMKALEFLSTIGLERIQNHENQLLFHLQKELETLEKVTVYGPAKSKERGPILSFNIEGMNPHDVAVILDESGKFILRSGTMCSHLLFQKLQMQGVVQLSTHGYNTKDEVNNLITAIQKIAHDLA